MPEVIPSDKSIILFDGACNFCNASINFIWKRDKNDCFRFASLQSKIADEAFKNHNIPSAYTQDLSTIILIEKGKLYQQSTAVLKIAKKLSGLYPLFYFFIIIPPIIRDYFYRQIAKRRNLLFKNKNSCELPPVEKRHVFLST